MYKYILVFQLIVGLALAENRPDVTATSSGQTSLSGGINYSAPDPFAGEPYAKICDTSAIGEWWKKELKGKSKEMVEWFQELPREEAVAFAFYTHDHGVLKISGQCFPLLPKEPKQVTLEFQRDGDWVKADQQPVHYPGWDVHFRVEEWDNTQDVPFRLRLGDLSSFEGLIRKDPVDQDVIVVANLSCNSPKDKERFSRNAIVGNLKKHDPDLLFFAGDQNYTHEEATFGWLQFGVQYRDVMRDRPTVCIPDDHDVGHGNIWGAGGKKSAGTKGASDGGYKFPAAFVNMVERQQTWNLPDAFDPTPVQQGIGVYYTDLNVGGISLAILEDRKFKSPPLGNIPEMGPRPDHIIDPNYDRKAVDLPGLVLLGDRQLAFLDAWVKDWTDAEMKAVLSQTAFCGAVHMHGSPDNRLLADLDCNGWPQSGRNRALERLQAARATHLCGDQHLAAVVKHGITSFRDGPMAFTSPALVNTIYGRWWEPEDKQPGGGKKIKSSLPYVGDYHDGLGNKITMMAYANPEFLNTMDLRKDTVEQNRGDGYGLVRFNKKKGTVTFEAWPRYADVSQGDKAQYEGWPITFKQEVNDGRKAVGYLKRMKLPVKDAVVELLDANGDTVYCYRVKGSRFKAPVFASGTYTLMAGEDTADQVVLENITVE